MSRNWKLCAVCKSCSQFQASNNPKQHINPKMKISQYSSIISMNEKAILMMRSSKFASAAEVFHEAIDKVEEAFETEDIEMEDDMDFPMHQGDRVMGAIAPVGVPDTTIAQEASLSFTLYGNATTMIQNPAVSPDTSLEYDDLNLLHASLFFNLALCHHLQGLESGKSAHFREAILCYDTVLGTIGQVEKRNPFVMVIELASLNNCAHIHNIFCERPDFHQCLKLMKDVLCEVTKGWVNPVPKQVTEFSHNLLMNSSHSSRPAPAA